MANSCEHGNEPSGSTKCGEFDYLNGYWHLEKDSAPPSSLLNVGIKKNEIWEAISVRITFSWDMTSCSLVDR